MSNYVKIIFKISVSSGHAVSQVLAMLSWLVDCVEVMKTINIEDFIFRNSDDSQDSRMERALTKTVIALYSDYKVLGDACLTEDRVEEMFSKHHIKVLL